MDVDEETQEAARVTFEDGTVEFMTAAPGVYLSGETLAEFTRACLKSPVKFTVEAVLLAGYVEKGRFIMTEVLEPPVQSSRPDQPA